MLMHHYTKADDFPIRVEDFKPHAEAHAEWRKEVGYVYHKPHGLWLSDDREWGWKAWCEVEMPEWIADTLRFAIEVETEDVLVIDTEDKFKAFNTWLGPKPFDLCVDWEPVMAAFKGIIIAPYFPQFRSTYSTMWYNTWDCASGCIWDYSCLSKIRETENYVSKLAS